MNRIATLGVLAAVALATSASAAPAQTESADAAAAPLERTAIKRLMYLEADELGRMMELLGVRYVVDPGGDNALVLRGPESNLDQALKAIDALDVPAPTIYVSVFVLGVSKEAGGEVDVPADILAAVTELQRVFGYARAELLESVALRVRDGRRGFVKGLTVESWPSGESEKASFQVSFRSANLLPEESGGSIRLSGFEYQGRQIVLSSDVEVREGQTAVVGKSTAGGSDTGIVLVVRVRSESDAPSQQPAPGTGAGG